MDLLKAFRISEPILLFIGLWIVLGGLLFLNIKRFRRVNLFLTKHLSLKLLHVSKIGLVLVIASYLSLVIAYTLSSTFFDQAEPNIAAVSWLFKTGHPLFPPLDSADRYINNYGAVLYIINSFFLTLLGPSFFSVKLGCGLAAIASVGLLFLSATRISTRPIALLVCAYAVLAMMSITNSFAFPAASFWLRPDPLLIFFVSLGLFGVLSRNQSIAILLTAIAFGCSLNLKINAFVNFLPIYVLLFQRFGLVATLTSGAGALVTAALPFLVFSQISLSNFLVWLSQSRYKPSSFEQLWEVSKWFFYILLPISLSLAYLFCRDRASLRQFISSHRSFIYTLLGCLIASLAFSHKIGVLANNHLPFIPLLAYLLALLLEWIRVEEANFSISSSTRYVNLAFVSAALSLMVTLPVAIAPDAGRLISTLAKSPGSQVIGDINNVIKSHLGSTIGMGFSQGSGNYELTYYRPVLVFAGNPYLVDPVVMFEMQVSNVSTVSRKTIDALKTCQTKIWLLPKITQNPFDLKNFYPPHDLVFTEEFRNTFLRRYSLSEESKFYDLWTCKKDTNVMQ